MTVTLKDKGVARALRRQPYSSSPSTTAAIASSCKA
ncbi:hypothetical protein ABID12_002686 [Martelella mangrovi]|uniref:Uncharacterized protein n=1 Tax=Martelella mangrovi TaxID=1397477 RepID=A0ABV2ICT3_9HYPH